MARALIRVRTDEGDELGPWLMKALSNGKDAITEALVGRATGLAVTIDSVVHASEPWELEGCEPLNRREKQIAWLIVQGLKRAEVAETIPINPRTFDTHRLHLLAKLRCANEVQLARLAIAKGWVEL